MKILLTHGYFMCDDEAEQRINRPYVPLGILYISSWLTKHGTENDVFDTTFSTRHQLESHLKNEKYDVIGIYVNLVTKLSVLQLINFIRSQGELRHTKIILGGPDITYNIKNYLEAGADFVISGEGEITFRELITCIREKSSFSLCHGISFIENGKVISNPPREKIKNADDIPLPARDKIDIKKYLGHFHRYHGQTSLSVSTQRGCPYTCKWCSTAVYGQSYRRRSPSRVVEELILLKKEYNVDRIWFVDDVFTVSHNWMRDFHSEIIKQNVSVEYECITRADRLNEEMIRLLKESGCFRLWIGAESGSQKVIDAMDRRVEVGQVREMIRAAGKAGIETGTFIMLGYPGETEKDIMETVHHLKVSSPDSFTITVAYPIKGTALYNEVESELYTNDNWKTSTDRHYDFRRTYSRKYYNAAVRYVVNEVNFHLKKEKQGMFHPSVINNKVKSIVARTAMRFLK